MSMHPMPYPAGLGYIKQIWQRIEVLEHHSQAGVIQVEKTCGGCTIKSQLAILSLALLSH
jgi:hypothetical protein